MIGFVNLGHRDCEAHHGGPAPVTFLFVPCGGKFGLWRQTNLDSKLSHISPDLGHIALTELKPQYSYL